jgi:hypothetical protein
LSYKTGKHRRVRFADLMDYKTRRDTASEQAMALRGAGTGFKDRIRVRHSPFTAVYDACVLYPAPLRDLLMWLALSGRFRARWTQEIHGEWKRNLLKNRTDLTMEQLDRTSELMDRAIPDACVTMKR